MAQMPCESSLRPDWLATTFKSASSRHQESVWTLAQMTMDSIAPDVGWDESSGSRHFDRVLQHPAGMRFEYSSIKSERNAGLALITCTGKFFSLSSVYEQMRFFERIHSFKGRFHYTRLDAQVTTLNPSQSAEQIVTDVNENRLWIKGYRGFESHGLRDINGEPTGGLSACFGAPSSDRRATSYNKAAEQGWTTPARRDETRLRGQWAEEHTALIATSVAGATSENEAIDAYQQATATALVQHMQYLSLEGKALPRPKDWARTAKVPKWWSETLEQEITPVKLNRKEQNDCWRRLSHCTDQYGRTFFECVTDLLASGRSKHPSQALYDVAQQMLSKAKPEDIRAAAEALGPEQAKDFVNLLEEAKNSAAEHLEFV